ARGSLAMDPHAAATAVDGVLLELGDVVCDIVDEAHAQLLPRAPEEPFEDLARLPHQELAIAPGEVGRGAHGADVVDPLGAVRGRAGELAVGQIDPVLLRN